MITAIPPQYSVVILRQVSPGSWGSIAESLPNCYQAFTGNLSTNFSYSASATYDAPFQVGNRGGILGGALRIMGVQQMTPVMTAQLWSGSEIPEFQLDIELEAETDPLLEIRNPIVELLKLVTPTVQPDTGMLQSPGPNVDVIKTFTNNAMVKTQSQKKDGGIGSFNENFGGVVNEVAAKENRKNVSSGSTVNSSQGITTEEISSGLGEIMGGQYWMKSNLISGQISIAIGTYIYFPSVVITNVECDFLHLLHASSGWPMSAKVTVQFKPLFMPTQEDFDIMFGPTS